MSGDNRRRTIQAAPHPHAPAVWYAANKIAAPASPRPRQPTRDLRVRTNEPSSGRPPDVAKRASLKMAAGALAGLMLPRVAGAKQTQPTFDQWIAAFQSKALARGITPETYARVMSGLKPDNTGLAAIREQPEFNEQLWQYLNRRVSDWRIIA